METDAPTAGAAVPVDPEAEAFYPLALQSPSERVGHSAKSDIMNFVKAFLMAGISYWIALDCTGVPKAASEG